MDSRDLARDDDNNNEKERVDDFDQKGDLITNKSTKRTTKKISEAAVPHCCFRQKIFLRHRREKQNQHKQNINTSDQTSRE
jgi:hypothetical protein